MVVVGVFFVGSPDAFLMAGLAGDAAGGAFPGVVLTGVLLGDLGVMPFEVVVVAVEVVGILVVGLERSDEVFTALGVAGLEEGFSPLTAGALGLEPAAVVAVVFGTREAPTLAGGPVFLTPAAVLTPTRGCGFVAAPADETPTRDVLVAVEAAVGRVEAN